MDIRTGIDRQLTLPQSLPEQAKSGIPLFALIVPVISAGVLFVLTRSPLSLAFAAIGPLAAGAALLDGRRGLRRTKKKHREERLQQLTSLRSQIKSKHDSERENAWRRTPAVRDAVQDCARRWRPELPNEILVGRGIIASRVWVNGEPANDSELRLQQEAAKLYDAPVTASITGGIGWRGVPELVYAAVRAALIQLASQITPGMLVIKVPETAEWSWLPMQWRALNRGSWSPIVVHIHDSVISPGVSEIALVIANEHEQFQHGLQTVIEVRSAGEAKCDRHNEEHESDNQYGVVIAPELLGEHETKLIAAELGITAERYLAKLSKGTLPRSVSLSQLQEMVVAFRDADGLSPDTDFTNGMRRESLTAVVGTDGERPVLVDLVKDGPHALVGGTTGSGKSELLVSWLVAIAQSYSVYLVSFLLIDFKGGATFSPIAELPHVTGIVTDLDEAEAERAVRSLRAELVYRERVLRRAMVKDIGSLPDDVELARLVVVVDEYQAMIERFPGLGTIFADLAARGRSLGVHLILAAQRPNGVVREQISANCTLRICLRVLQPEDSRAIVGTDVAAKLPADCPGRAVIAKGDWDPQTVQLAILGSWLPAISTGERARRIWLDPVPSGFRVSAIEDLLIRSSTQSRTVKHAALSKADIEETSASEVVTFGISDEPDKQQWVPAQWCPKVDGSLLVLGAPGSGRSTALAAVAESFAQNVGKQQVTTLPEHAGAAWEVLQAAARIKYGSKYLLVIDDLDLQLRRWPDEYRAAAEQLFEKLLRNRNGVAVAASLARPLGVGAAVREAFGCSLLLRHASRAEFLQAGGSSELLADNSLWSTHLSDVKSGCGQWRGLRTQVAIESLPPVNAPAPPALELPVGIPIAVVSRNPTADAETLEKELGVRSMLLGADVRLSGEQQTHTSNSAARIGTAETWANAWAIQNTVRSKAAIVVKGELADYRVLIRDRELPPLITPGSDECWLALPGKPTVRRLWPNRN